MTLVEPEPFRWMLPGERRIAMWGTYRVRKVQGDSRKLVAGGYIILAAIWGSVGGIIMVAAIVVMTATKGNPNPFLYVAGFVFLGIGFIRQIQSRNARRNGEP
ncbi:MAG TPA: hypothetical protein VMU64_02095 [Acidimicrobiales bacterium]|nr:hypothetical protein [Acidimicrobiales bacterium]